MIHGPPHIEAVENSWLGYSLIIPSHHLVIVVDGVSKVYRLIKSTGVYMVYDFISGNVEMFVKTMVEHGMSEERARKRYPHMCRHSVDEIKEILETSGFSDSRTQVIDEIRAVVVGLKR